MGDKRKLIAAMMSAITAYIDTEEQPPVTPRSKPKAKVSRWQVSKRQELMKTRIMPTRKEKAK